MSLSVEARGTDEQTSTGTTITITPTANFTANSMGVIVVAMDNPNDYPFNSLTDTQGNTWTERIFQERGTGNNGAFLHILTTAQDGGTLTTGDTITYDHDSCNQRQIALWEVKAGGTPAYVTGAAANGSGYVDPDWPTITTSSITSGNVVIGGLAFEYSSGVSGDADTSNGTWSSAQQSSGGTGVAGMTISTQYKVTTGTATQTYNPTGSNATDWCIGWIEIEESGGGGGGARSFAVVIA